MKLILILNENSIVTQNHTWGSTEKGFSFKSETSLNRIAVRLFVLWHCSSVEVSLDFSTFYRKIQIEWYERKIFEYFHFQQQLFFWDVMEEFARNVEVLVEMSATCVTLILKIQKLQKIFFDILKKSLRFLERRKTLGKLQILRLCNNCQY